MFELHTDWPLVKAGLFTTLSPSHTNVSAPPSPVLRSLKSHGTSISHSTLKYKHQINPAFPTNIILKVKDL